MRDIHICSESDNEAMTVMVTARVTEKVTVIITDKSMKQNINLKQLFMVANLHHQL